MSSSGTPTRVNVQQPQPKNATTTRPHPDVRWPADKIQTDQGKITTWPSPYNRHDTNTGAQGEPRVQAGRTQVENTRVEFAGGSKTEIEEGKGRRRLRASPVSSLRPVSAARR